MNFKEKNETYESRLEREESRRIEEAEDRADAMMEEEDEDI